MKTLSSWSFCFHLMSARMPCGYHLPSLCRIEIEPRIFGMLGKTSTAELNPSPRSLFDRLVEVKIIWLLCSYIFNPEEGPVCSCPVCLWPSRKLAPYPKFLHLCISCKIGETSRFNHINWDYFWKVVFYSGGGLQHVPPHMRIHSISYCPTSGGVGLSCRIEWHLIGSCSFSSLTESNRNAMFGTLQTSCSPSTFHLTASTYIFLWLFKTDLFVCVAVCHVGGVPAEVKRGFVWIPWSWSCRRLGTA